MTSKWLIACHICLLCSITQAKAQSEFPKGWIFPLELGQGAVSALTAAPDLYLATLSFSPQVTVVPGRLRLGLIAGGAFTNKTIYGTGGGRLALLLWNGPKVLESTIMNAQLVGEYILGTKDQRLAGGGLAVEIGTIATLAVKAHRDYALGNWWFQGSIGVNLFRQKIAPPPSL